MIRFGQGDTNENLEILEMQQVLRLGILSLLAGHSIGLVCYTCSGKNGECSGPADPGKAITCTSVRALLQPSVMEELDVKWEEIRSNKKKATIFAAFESVFAGVDRRKGDLSLVFEETRNMTFDNTTYDQLAEMTADVLAQVVAAEEEVPENACTYNEKTVTNQPGIFRRCLYRSALRMADWAEIKKNLLRNRDWPNGVKPTDDNMHRSAKLCIEDRCNKKGTRSCYECEGPNHQCVEGSVGISMACPATHKYCIKELSGDATNRELVARYCGTEYDREAICNRDGDNIGIAAKGQVRCCSNDEAEGGANDCNQAPGTTPLGWSCQHWEP